MTDDSFADVLRYKEQSRLLWEKQAAQNALEMLRCAAEARLQEAAEWYVATEKALAFASNATSFEGNGVQEAEKAVKKARERADALLRR